MEETKEETPVKVSVVIPIRNEERYIQKCLDSVLSRIFPTISGKSIWWTAIRRTGRRS